MRESRTYGSVRGALGNERPYRDPEEHRPAPDSGPERGAEVRSPSVMTSARPRSIPPPPPDLIGAADSSRTTAGTNAGFG